MKQTVNLYDYLHADRVGPAPLVIRAVVTPSLNEYVGGVPETAQRGEVYVLLSALPDELRRRVELAIQALAK